MPEVAYHPEAQAVIDMINAGSASAPALGEQPLDAVRMGYAGWYGMNGPGPEISEVRDVMMLRDGGPPIPARVYRPTEATDAPMVVFFHGGGMVIGSMDVYDGVCRQLAEASGAVIVNVDYRLAPENPAPAQLDDAWDAVRWTADHAADIGGSEEKLIVCGDSAGGNLAALCALRARDEGTPHVALQMLIYPVTDWTFASASMEENGVGNFLTKETMLWFRQHYLGDDETQWSAPERSPLYAAVDGVCPAWVLTTSHDPLRDEGTAYAAKLEAAGVPTIHVRVDGMFHAFFGQTNVVPTIAKKALADAAATIRAVSS